MRHPRIVAFEPRRPWAKPGAVLLVEATVEPGPRPAELSLSLLDLDRAIATHRRSIPPSRHPVRRRFRLSLPRAPRHGYGLRLRLADGRSSATARSAVEALEGWWQSPRHAAMTAFGDPASAVEDARSLPAWHVTVVQCYDWMWRHYRFTPPDGSDPFVDPLGRLVSHAAVRAAVEAGHAAGIAALAYGSVYGAEPEYVESHPDELVRDDEGQPLSLGGLFFITDLRARSSWRRRLLGEYRRAVDEFGFDGVHMDTYGPPHVGVTADGEHIDFATIYPGLISEAEHAVGAARPGSRLIFNCVAGFALEAVAAAPVSVLYLEIWPPESTFGHVVDQIVRARACARGRPVVIAAYAAALKTPARGPSRREAFEATLLLGCVIAAAGAYHHTLAAGERLLVEGYYPAAVELLASEVRALRALWAFTARYVHLLSEPERITVEPVGLRVRDASGHAVPTSARPIAGAIWTWASVGSDGKRVVHLVDLRAQPDERWDEPKVVSSSSSDLRLEWPGVREVVVASPWTRGGDARGPGPPDREAGWSLPSFRRWLMIAEDGPSHGQSAVGT